MIRPNRLPPRRSVPVTRATLSTGFDNADWSSARSLPLASAITAPISRLLEGFAAACTDNLDTGQIVFGPLRAAPDALLNRI